MRSVEGNEHAEYGALLIRTQRHEDALADWCTFTQIDRNRRLHIHTQTCRMMHIKTDTVIH